jgi:hypothetical protein
VWVYALRESWGRPHAVIGFSAEDAERFGEFLERGSGGYGAADRGPEPGQRYVPGRPLPQVFAVASVIKP